MHNICISPQNFHLYQYSIWTSHRFIHLQSRQCSVREGAGQGEGGGLSEQGVEDMALESSAPPSPSSGSQRHKATCWRLLCGDGVLKVKRYCIFVLGNHTLSSASMVNGNSKADNVTQSSNYVQQLPDIFLAQSLWCTSKLWQIVFLWHRHIFKIVSNASKKCTLIAYLTLYWHYAVDSSPNFTTLYTNYLSYCSLMLWNMF